mgnify:CR=1 FL=1
MPEAENGKDDDSNDIDMVPEASKKSGKVARSCWGCGKQEESGIKFKACPKCVEAEWLPSVFCSNECFKDNWKSHKAWHKEHEAFLQKLLEDRRPCPEGALVESNVERSEYDSIVAEADTLVRRNDFIGAKKTLKKALKLDPKSPEAYFEYGICFSASGQYREACHYFEKACERYASLWLTGKFGENLTTDQFSGWVVYNWAISVYRLVDRYLVFFKDVHDYEKPSWYYRDGILKRMTKLALEIIKADPKKTEEIKCTMALIRGAVLLGMIHNGEFHRTGSPPDDRTKEDLIEAAECFHYVSIRESDQIVREGFQSLAEISMKNAETATSVKSIDRYIDDGAWVFVVDLQSPSGLAMNGSLGRVMSPLNGEGRYAVEVDGVEGLKFIKPENLLEVSFDHRPMPIVKDYIFAIIGCLEDTVQWKWMRYMVK